MKVLISAAEASSDQHASQLLKALKKQNPSIKAFGVGGKKLRSEGLEVIVPAEDLLSMGFTEILTRLPKIFSALNQIAAETKKRRPDFVVLVDYPDFHFRLSKKIRKLGIPVYYFIPPKVWAWRKNRIRFLKKYFEHLYCIFPFEKKFYDNHAVSSSYVGNPILNETDFSSLKKPSSARRVQQLAVLPGSRPSELKRHLNLFLTAAAIYSVKNRNSNLQVNIPLATSLSKSDFEKKINRWKQKNPSDSKNLNIKFSEDSSEEVFMKSDIGIIKSGTSTLEAAVYGVPHVVVFRTSWLTNFIFDHIISYKGPIALSNLLSHWKLGSQYPFTELLGKNANPKKIADELMKISSNQDTVERRENLAGIQAVRSNLNGDGKPAGLIAKDLLNRVSCYKSLGHREPVLWIRMISFFWSSINWFRRKLGAFGLFRGKKIKPKVISVGNIQAGGAGKTPLVIKIAKEAILKGLYPVVLLRGYKGQWEKKGGVIYPFDSPVSVGITGDEAAVIQRELPGIWIGVGRNRVRQFEKIQKIARQSIDLVILDDGFQNNQIQKDIEVLALTHLNSSQMPFRDRWSQVKHADLLVWTKGKNQKENISHPREILANYRMPFLENDSSLTHYLMTGVGMGEQVQSQLEKQGIQFKKHFIFSDHHSYAKKEFLEIEGIVQSSHSRLWMTVKDWVKWRERLELSDPPNSIKLIELEIHFSDPENDHKIWNEVLWHNISSIQS